MQSQNLLAIEKTVRQFVEDDFSVVSLLNFTLTLTTPSGSSATRLRYRERNILTSIRRAGLDVKHIKIKVSPKTALKPPTDIELSQFLSTDNAHHIAQTAQYIEDEPLRKALIALSMRTKSRE